MDDGPPVPVLVVKKVTVADTMEVGVRVAIGENGVPNLILETLNRSPKSRFRRAGRPQPDVSEIEVSRQVVEEELEPYTHSYGWGL